MLLVWFRVNDAVVAHAGALQSKPGIIVILGTGSILFAATEQGRQIRNYDFTHYAASTARHLAYDAVFRIIAGQFSAQDQQFASDVLAYWGVPDREALCTLGINGFVADRQERNRLFGEMAPLLTSAAANGVPLAQSVCDAAVDAVETGVRILGQCFSGEEIPVSLIGSVARSAYIHSAISERMRRNSGSDNKKYVVASPSFSAVAGAVFLAFKQLGIDVEGFVSQALKQHPAARYEQL